MAIRYTLIFLILNVYAWSQAKFEFHKKNIVKINPLGGIASSIPLSVERFFLKNTFSICGTYTMAYSQSGSEQTTYNTKGFVIMPQTRYYFYNDTLNRASIYLGGFYTYEEFYNETKDRYGKYVIGSVFGQGGGIIFGTQWFLKNNFVFDIYVGPGYTEYKKNNNYDNNVAKGGFLVSFTGSKNTSTKVKLGFSIGYSF